MSEAARIDAKAARFAPVDITVDLSALPAQEQQALARLVEAAKVMDALFLRQVWAGNEALLLDLLKDGSPAGRARLRYFLINKGPWSRLDGNEPFVPGVPPKPPEANFYPAGATKEEVEAWLGHAARGGTRSGRPGSSRRSAAQARRPARQRALQPRVPGRTGRAAALCARRPSHGPAVAEGVS